MKLVDWAYEGKRERVRSESEWFVLWGLMLDVIIDQKKLPTESSSIGSEIFDSVIISASAVVRFLRYLGLVQERWLIFAHEYQPHWQW